MLVKRIFKWLQVECYLSKLVVSVSIGLSF